MGVVGAITPWNVPVGLAAHKIAQGLVAGNTMVLKPSPYTPLATLLLGELSRDILPPGVFNVVAGGNDLGQWLTEHPGIDRISFTGSVATGKRVMASAAGTLKRVTLELGGNDPAILLDDADLAAMTPKIFGAAFANCGQVCMAIKRVYVPERNYEQVCESLAELAKNYRVGDGFEPDVQMGPLQNKMQYDKVLDVLEDTKRQPGVRILAGGHTLNQPGYFLAPTIVADISDDSRLVTEEQFGPILPVLKYREIDEAVARANDTRMGLCASVWTKDIEKGAAVAARIEAGTVWVNHHLGSEADVPFGGFKESGVGREHGVMGLAELHGAAGDQSAGGRAAVASYPLSPSCVSFSIARNSLFEEARAWFFDRPIQRDDLFSHRGERGAAAVLTPGRCRDGGLAERCVDFFHQQPSAAIRHIEAACGPGYRARLADRFQQGDLSGPDPFSVRQIYSDRELSSSTSATTFLTGEERRLAQANRQDPSDVQIRLAKGAEKANGRAIATRPQLLRNFVRRSPLRGDLGDLHVLAPVLDFLQHHLLRLFGRQHHLIAAGIVEELLGFLVADGIDKPLVDLVHRRLSAYRPARRPTTTRSRPSEYPVRSWSEALARTEGARSSRRPECASCLRDAAPARKPDSGRRSPATR